MSDIFVIKIMLNIFAYNTYCVILILSIYYSYLIYANIIIHITNYHFY